MKKILLTGLILFSIFFTLIGCSLSNTPTAQVEDLFLKYQKLDNDITNEITNLLSVETLTENQRERYRKLIENQYKNLSYEIKDETINGDNALVTVQIEVLDYRKTISGLNTSENTNFDVLEYNNQKLDKLEKTKEKVAYTLNINVFKDNDGNWKISNLTNDDIKKIQGMY